MDVEIQVTREVVIHWCVSLRVRPTAPALAVQIMYPTLFLRNSPTFSSASALTP